MNTPAMLAVLCGHERDGWIHPGVVDSLLAAIIQDSQTHSRAVGVNLVAGYRPIAHARCKAVDDFLASPCEWLAMIDNDTVPRFRVLDIIKAAEEEGKSLVAAPTPIYSNQVTWNYKATRLEDTWATTLPQGWFKPCVIGAGFLAMRRRVLDTLKQPVFHGPFEDVAFCIKASDAGFPVWAHSRFVCSHFHTVDLLNAVPR